jgi:hypothetical protein
VRFLLGECNSNYWLTIMFNQAQKIPGKASLSK